MHVCCLSMWIRNSSIESKPSPDLWKLKKLTVQTSAGCTRLWPNILSSSIYKLFTRLWLMWWLFLRNMSQGGIWAKQCKCKNSHCLITHVERTHMQTIVNAFLQSVQVIISTAHWTRGTTEAFRKENKAEKWFIIFQTSPHINTLKAHVVSCSPALSTLHIVSVIMLLV